MTPAPRCGSGSRSATNFPTTSPNGRTISTSPIQSSGQQVVGPELLVGDLPADINGMSRASGAAKEVIWEKPFLSGEQNMAHTIANLEAHHFKYGLFRRPGDVHVHFFGTATLSFSDGVKTEKGDMFEIESEPFGLPLRNRLWTEKPAKARVRAL